MTYFPVVTSNKSVNARLVDVSLIKVAILEMNIWRVAGDAIAEVQICQSAGSVC
jgi:hypothetical protein